MGGLRRMQKKSVRQMFADFRWFFLIFCDYSAVVKSCWKHITAGNSELPNVLAIQTLKI